MKPPRYKQSFIVNGKYLGEAMRYAIQVHEEKNSPCSMAYFCPVCGVTWAIFPVLDEITGKQSDFMPYRVPCTAHTSTEWGAIPGSIWSGWDKEFNSILPDDVIRYEFTQAVKLYKE
jgi:hypothetical protein